MDVVNDLAFDELEESLLDILKLLSAKAVAIVVEPLPFPLYGTEASLADDPQRSG